jgi:hypothetical protein
MILDSPWPPQRGPGGNLACQGVSISPGQRLANWDPRRAPIADPGRCLVAHDAVPSNFLPGRRPPPARQAARPFSADARRHEPVFAGAGCVGSLVADLALRHLSGRTLLRVNPETLPLGELVDCLRETGAITRARSGAAANSG